MAYLQFMNSAPSSASSANDMTALMILEIVNTSPLLGGDVLDMPHTCRQSIKTTSLSKIFRTRGSTFPRVILRTQSVNSNH